MGEITILENLLEYSKYTQRAIAELRVERTGIILAREVEQGLVPFLLHDRYTIPTTTVPGQLKPALFEIIERIQQHGIVQSAEYLRETGARELGMRPEEIHLIGAYLLNTYNETEAQKLARQGAINIFATVDNARLLYHRFDARSMSSIPVHIKQIDSTYAHQILTSHTDSTPTPADAGDTAKILPASNIRQGESDWPAEALTADYTPPGESDWGEEWSASEDGWADHPRTRTPEPEPTLDATRAVNYLKTLTTKQFDEPQYAFLTIASTSLVPGDEPLRSNLDDLINSLAFQPSPNHVPFALLSASESSEKIGQALQDRVKDASIQHYAIVQDNQLKLYGADGAEQRTIDIPPPLAPTGKTPTPPAQPARKKTRIIAKDATGHLANSLNTLPAGTVYAKHILQTKETQDSREEHIKPTDKHSPNLDDLIEQDGEPTIPIAVNATDITAEIQKLAAYTQEHDLPGFGIVHDGELTFYNKGKTQPMQQTYAIPEIEAPAQQTNTPDAPASSQRTSQSQPAPQDTRDTSQDNTPQTKPVAKTTHARDSMTQKPIPQTQMIGHTTQTPKPLVTVVQDALDRQDTDKKTLKYIHKMTKPKRGPLRKLMTPFWNPIARTGYGIGLGVALSIGVARYSPNTHKDIQDAITQYAPQIDSIAEEVGISVPQTQPTSATDIRAIAREEAEAANSELREDIRNTISEEYGRIAARDAAERAGMNEDAIRQLVTQQYESLSGDLDEQVTNLHDLLERTRTEIETNRESTRTERGALDSRISDIAEQQAAYEQLNERIQELASQITAIREHGVDLGPYEQRLEGLNDELNTLESQIQEDVGALRSRVEQLERPIYPGDIVFEGELTFDAGEHGERTQQLLDAYRRKWVTRSRHEPRVSEYAMLLAEVSRDGQIDEALVEEKIEALAQQGIATQAPSRTYDLTFSWDYVISVSATDDITRAYQTEHGTAISANPASWTTLTQSRVYDLCVKNDRNGDNRLTDQEMQ